MALFAIGDLHLSETAAKPMDIFNGWQNHTEKLKENWQNTVGPDDVVVICGDVSWGMSLQEALADFKLIDALNGRQKLILKGNHDYWWTSAAKMRAFFADNGLATLSILHNNAYEAEGFRICGSRGWIFEKGETHDLKIVNREAARIEASLKAAETLTGERVLFLHYPPVFMGQETPEYLALMQKYGIKRCYYGHIHGAGHKNAINSGFKGVEYALISADFVKFKPIRVSLSGNL